jgi:hypothetical protein
VLFQEVDLAAFTTVFQQQNRLAAKEARALAGVSVAPDGSSPMPPVRTETVSRAPKIPSVLEPNKARNLAIALRRVPLSVGDCARAITDVDTSVIGPELAEMLLAEFVIPAEEVARISARADAGERLAETDDFVLQVALNAYILWCCVLTGPAPCCSCRASSAASRAWSCFAALT